MEYFSESSSPSENIGLSLIDINQVLYSISIYWYMKINLGRCIKYCMLYSIKLTFQEYDDDSFQKLLNVCLCFTSLQQRGHLATAPTFTVPCEGCEA